MNMQKGIFCFTILNSKDTIEKNTDNHSGIGLNNVKRRLELLYPGKHVLLTKDTVNEFRVELQLNIIKQE
jgi:LytS/YehU family sensor histidine kinase